MEEVEAALKSMTNLRSADESGIVVIEMIKYSNETFKLGMAWGSGGLYNRIIPQYKICFAGKDEFFLRYLVICPRQKKGANTSPNLWKTSY